KKSATNILKERFCFYVVHHTNNSFRTFERPIPFQFVLCDGLRENVEGRFNVTLEAGAGGGYMNLLSGVGALRSGYYRNVALDRDDPQYEIHYILKPETLMELQQKYATRGNCFVLFQRYICAPRKCTQAQTFDVNGKTTVASVQGGLEISSDL